MHALEFPVLNFGIQEIVLWNKRYSQFRLSVVLCVCTDDFNLKNDNESVIYTL